MKGLRLFFFEGFSVHFTLEISPVYEGIKTLSAAEEISVGTLEISPVYEGIKTLDETF